jgi:hypothetical protein
MTIYESIQQSQLNGEAKFSVTFSQIGCNHDTLIIMWYHTESFGEVKFMVIARIETIPE